MTADDEGITQIGRNLYAVRVNRREERTGRTRNRKATVEGSKADARRVRNELRDQLASTATRPRRLRLHEYAASWLERRRPSLKASTIRRYGYALEKILPRLGEIFVDSLTIDDVAKYMAARRKEQAGNTINNELRLLRTIARDSVAEGLAARYWCDRVAAAPVAKYTDEDPNLFTAETFPLVMQHVHRRWHGLVLLLATTGLRWGEASALHWRDIKRGVATIRYTNDRGTLTDPKTEGSTRTVVILPEVLLLIGPRRGDLVFTTAKGTIHRGNPLVNVLRRACKKAGLGYMVTAHGLRRTFNNAGRTVLPREVLKSITGHTTDKMMEHYSLVGAAEKSSAAAAVGRVLRVVK